ncbi:hypothetical protein CAP35_14275 [Chitinophagaceae bacterium IBVUCB1]|nr:hypothetical protein CAP35_14275 [Chitinophagaceae bacterium IBVUCB1]
MKKLLLAMSVLLACFHADAQVIAHQGFDAAQTNTWGFTPTPAPYNFPSLNDVWADTTALGNTNSGNVPILAAPQGTRFWAINDLENPVTTSLGAPFFHFLDFAPVSLNPLTEYTVKFRYFTHIVGGSGDSTGYIVEFNNGTTWNAANYVNLPFANKIWDSVSIPVPLGSTFVRLRVRTRLNGNDDWIGYDAFQVVAGATILPTTVQLRQNLFIFDEASDTARIGVVISNKNNSVTTTVNVNYLHNFTTVDGGDIQVLDNVIGFGPLLSDTQFVRVIIKNDNVKEVTEYFGLELSNPVNGILGSTRKAIVYIRDNDYTAPVARKNIEMQHLGSYPINIAGSSAEIVAFDSAANKLYVVNSLKNRLHILDFNNPAALTQTTSIDMSTYGGGINSVAVRKGIVAIAVEALPKTDSGKVVFLDAAGTFLKEIKTGALPDMITFTPDGKYVLTANEGEPNDNYSIDPEGSITMVDLQNGVANATGFTVQFTKFNGSEPALRNLGIRIFGVGANAARDFEPEYITVSKNSDKAWITLQENNAIAVLDIANKDITGLFPLRTSDHSKAGFALDASDNNGQVMIANWPVRGMYMPDAIANFTVGNNTYLVTANEGDAREYAALTEESRIGSSTYVLDPVKFPHADLMKANHNLGRLNAVRTSGDTDNDGDFDEIHVLGSRSFSIWNAESGARVYDAGQDLEQITLADPKFGKLFNASNDGNTTKNRSDNKGPEPEGVAVGVINDTTYAFVALERIGGVMAYNVQNPTAPVFVQYINTRDTATYGGDNGCEGIIFLHEKENKHGKHYVITANEISGTIAVFEVKATKPPTGNVKNVELPAFNAYPNPVQNGVLYFSQTITGGVYDMAGKKVASFEHANSVNTTSLAKGIYTIQAQGFATQKVVIQ